VDKARVPNDCTPCKGQKSKVFEAQQQAFKVWTEGEQVFILTTQGSEDDLADFI
jgi:NOL1/NOP2/fmu family ribosome biogenesis protein